MALLLITHFRLLVTSYKEMNPYVHALHKMHWLYSKSLPMLRDFLEDYQAKFIKGNEALNGFICSSFEGSVLYNIKSRQTLPLLDQK